MATQWDDLLTPGEVQTAAVESSSVFEDNPGGVVEETIRDVQDRIARYLGMDPMVHKRTEGLRRRDWLEDETADPQTYRAWADHQPIVEVESPSEVSARFDAKQLTRSRPAAGRVMYFAGWRRSKQTLSDLDGSSGGDLTNLTTEPEPLPRDIRLVAIRLVVFYVTDGEHGAGIGQVTQAVGSGQTTTVEGPEPNFEQNELRKLSGYKLKRV